MSPHARWIAVVVVLLPGCTSWALEEFEEGGELVDDPPVYLVLPEQTPPPEEPEPQDSTLFCDQRNLGQIGRWSYCASRGLSSWEQGVRYCETLGGRLAEFETQEQLQAVLQVLEPKAKHATVWLDTARRGNTWTWPKGERIELDDPAWVHQEPRHLDEPGFCPAFAGVRAGYVNVPCDRGYPTICELVDRDSVCDGEPLRTSFAEYCRLPGRDLVRDESRRACDERGMALLRLESPAERDAMADALGTPLRWETAWIGLDDRETEGDWRWLSGRPATFGWRSSMEPNNARGGEDCAEFRVIDGGFNDLRCHLELPSLCQLPIAKR